MTQSFSFAIFLIGCFIVQATYAEGSWWKLEGLDKSEVEKFASGTKTWEKENYYKVTLSKGGPDLGLDWRNEKDAVAVQIDVRHRNGKKEVKQEWIFNFEDRVVVKLTQRMDGRNSQIWEFEGTTYQVGKNSKGVIDGESWTRGEDRDSLEKSKQNIETWCLHNENIVGKENCLIY